MSLPELVAPVIAVGSPAALTGIILRFGPDAALRLLAGTVAVLTHDQTRGERCLEVLRVLRRTGQRPEPDSAPCPPDTASGRTT
jgi:hypothetical protein